MNFKAPTIAWLYWRASAYIKILSGFKPSIRKHPSQWFWHPSRPFLGDQDQTPLFLSAGMISRNFHKDHRNVPGASGQTVTFLDYPPSCHQYPRTNSWTNPCLIWSHYLLRPADCPSPWPGPDTCGAAVRSCFSEGWNEKELIHV